MSNAVLVTMLVRFETREASPSFSAKMQVLGGELVAVSFSDLFAERDGLEAELETLRDHAA